MRELLKRIEHKLDTLIRIVVKEGAAIMALQDTLTKLTSDVTAQNTVVASVQTLLAGLTKAISDLRSQVADPATVAALDGLVTQIEANTTTLAQAVTANTPAT